MQKVIYASQDIFMPFSVAKYHFITNQIKWSMKYHHEVILEYFFRLWISIYVRIINSKCLFSILLSYRYIFEEVNVMLFENFESRFLLLLSTLSCHCFYLFFIKDICNKLCNLLFFLATQNVEYAMIRYSPKIVCLIKSCNFHALT